MQIQLINGVIEIVPSPLDLELVARDTFTVAVAREEVPPMPQEVVDQTLDELRQGK